MDWIVVPDHDVRISNSPTDDNLYRRLGREMVSARDEVAFSVTVNGDSMSPAIRHGDRLTVEAVLTGQLSRGDILLVLRAEDFVTHRLLFEDASGYWLKGDNRRAADAPVSADRIVGRVTNIRRGGRDINPAAGWRKVANRWIGRASEVETRAYLRYRKLYNSQSSARRKLLRIMLACFGFPLFVLRFLSGN